MKKASGAAKRAGGDVPRARAAAKSSDEGVSPSRQIDAIIRATGGWRGRKLAQLRTVIRRADPAVVEQVKWKMPSKPMGVPVWSADGIVCIADTLKNAVRLTFPNGALMNDSKKLFNTRLDSKTVRAIDFGESDTVNEAALRALIRQAIRLETSRRRAR